MARKVIGTSKNREKFCMITAYMLYFATAKITNSSQLSPDLLYMVVSHSELDFEGAQKIEDLPKSEILQKLSLFCLAKKKFWS